MCLEKIERETEELLSIMYNDCVSGCDMSFDPEQEPKEKHNSYLRDANSACKRFLADILGHKNMYSAKLNTKHPKNGPIYLNSQLREKIPVTVVSAAHNKKILGVRRWVVKDDRIIMVEKFVNNTKRIRVWSVVNVD